MNALTAPLALDTLASQAPPEKRPAIRVVLTILRQMRSELDEPRRQVALVRLTLRTAGDWARQHADGEALVAALETLRDEFTAFLTREGVHERFDDHRARFRFLAHGRVRQALGAAEAALVRWAQPDEEKPAFAPRETAAIRGFLRGTTDLLPAGEAATERALAEWTDLETANPGSTPQ